MAYGPLSVGTAPYTLPPATATTLGGIKVGNGLSVDADGNLTANAQEYSLPTATASRLGGVKIGDYLDIAADGTLSGKTLNDRITAAVAVKSEARLVWNYQWNAPRALSSSCKIPDNADYVVFAPTYISGGSVQLVRGTTRDLVFGTSESSTTSYTVELQTDGTLKITSKRSLNYTYAVTIILTGYHYPTIAELLTDTQAAQADADAVNVDQEYRLTLLELGVTE